MRSQIITRSPFGARLVKARENIGLNQKGLADAVGMSQSTLGKLEVDGGSSGYTSQIAQRCGVSPVWLANGTGEMLAAGAPYHHDEPKIDPLADVRRTYGAEIMEMLARFTNRSHLNTAYARIIGEVDSYFAELQTSEPAHVPSVATSQPSAVVPKRKLLSHQ